MPEPGSVADQRPPPANAPRFVLLRTLPDGACCFRSVAAALLHDRHGLMVGGGTPRAMERSLRDVAANAVAAWLRYTAVTALATGRTDLLGAAIGPRGTSLDLVLRLARVACLRGGDVRHWRRALAPPAGLPPCDPDRLIGELPAHLHVDLKGGTLAAYCHRMLQPTSWGGAPEIYLLAERVLRRPILVVDSAAAHRYGPDDGSAPLLVLYSGRNHYDAILRLAGPVAVGGARESIT